jgi:predicted dehydrogenase
MSDILLPNRRDFVAATTIAGAAALSGAYADEGKPLSVGLVGCGGRGNGAVRNIMDADRYVKIAAFADVFPQRAQGSFDSMKKKYGERISATPATVFSGFDAYKKLLATDIDIVVLATPPGFRPLHLEAAIEAGKHVFTEKPVAVDPVGVRKVLALAEKAKAKKLGIAAGTQRRHQAGYLEVMKQVRDGAIGDIVSARAYWNGGDIWFNPRQKGEKDLPYQLRNWYHFLWLCGDHICEQHIHNLDIMNWALGANPVSASGMGGRSNRRVGDPKDVGHIFDHFAVEYEYPNGVIVQSYCRQIDGTPGNVSEALVGTKGRVYTRPGTYIINGKQLNADNEVDPYVQEHIDLIESIRAGKPINELENVAHSTMVAILGRMSTYMGKPLSWDQALKNSKLDLMPKNLDMDAELPVAPIPVVGKEKFV